MQTLGEMIGPVTATAPCKVCGDKADLYGVADFNKSCEEQHQKYLQLSGVPVYYHQCNACGFIFTNAFDHWSSADFGMHIYNNDYVLVDPDYVEVRARNNALLVSDFIKNAEGLKCLDYGGGNGGMAALLKSGGIDASSWDPFGSDTALPASKAFDFVSAFEVFEHTVDPVATAKESLGLLTEKGVLFFSTLTMDHVPPRGMDNWYIAPRNGHISLYTNRALEALFGGFGYHVHHFSAGTHMAIDETPEWLKNAGSP